MTLGASREARPRSGNSTILDHAYAEFCRRQALGEAVDVDAFVDEFPGVRGPLEKILRCHVFLEENPDLIEESPPEPWPEVGQEFAGYHLVRELGRGSLGRVYLAQQPALGHRQVVVKVSFCGGEEAATLGRLDHPHIVPVFSVDKHVPSDLAVVCMPYLGRATIRQVLDQIAAAGSVPERAAFLLDAVQDELAPDRLSGRSPYRADYVECIRRLGLRLAEALAFIHERGIIHRDLKPSNILMKPDGAPMLLDFNLAADRMRPERFCGGTWEYMAPEHLLACIPADILPDPCPQAPQITPASDVYSLGVILYELLGAAHPFAPLPSRQSARGFVNQMLERQQRRPPCLRGLNPRVDRALAGLIESCLAWAPEQRLTAAALAMELHRQAQPLPAVRRALARRPIRAGIVALALAAGAWLAYAAATPSRPTATSLQERIAASFQQGDFEHAVGLANQALNDAPNDVDLLFLRGRAHLALGEKDKIHFSLAHADFDACFAQKAEGRHKAGMAYSIHKVNAFPTARLLYEQALELGFTNAALHNNLARLQLVSGNLAKAEAHVIQALKANDRLGAVHYHAALMYWQKMHRLRPDDANRAPLLKKAVDHAKNILDLGPASVDFCFQAGKIYAAAAQHDDMFLEAALEQLDRACRLGMDSKKLKSIASFPALQNNGRFQRLVEQAPAQGISPLPAVLILDPLSY